MSIKSLRAMCEEAEPMTLDVVNVSKGVSAEMLSVYEANKLRDAAKGMGVDPNQNRLLYIVVSGEQVAGGLYAFVDEEVVRMSPVVVKDFTGKGVGEMLCKLARTEFRDNYDDQKKILELVVGKSLTPTLKKDGFILKDNVEHDTVTARLLPTGDRVQEILEDE